MRRVKITLSAKRDIKSAYDWWKEHRSAKQADRWYSDIISTIRSLGEMPESCPLAMEPELFEQGIRQRQFGIGRRATHRIVFAIEEDAVVVLRVRHTSQDVLSLEDLD